MEQQRPFQPSGIFLFDSKNPSRDGNSTGLWIVASNDIISESRVYCAERRATYTYVPAWSGVFLLPLGYTLSFTCWSERETEVPAAGEDRVNGLPFCGLRPRCFSLRRSECKPWRARVSGRREAEEQQSAREMGEVWKRLRNRTPADNSRRNLICRSVNQISREMRALETDPVLDNSPYGKSGRSDGQSRTDSVVNERIVCG